MKTAIICYSAHHGNTRKLVDAICEKHNVTLIDDLGKDADLSKYDCIGIASGVYASNLAKPLMDFAQRNLPEGKKVFYLYTSASTGEKALSKARALAASRGCEEAGAYYCKGYNTFGPFKLIGGTAKGHPTAEEIQGAVRFFEEITGAVR